MRGFIIFLMVLTSCHTYNEIGRDTYDVNGFKIFTSLGGVSHRTSRLFKSKGVKKAIVMNGGYIDDELNFNIQERNINDFLDKYVPDLNSDAIIVIDIEGKKMEALQRANDEALIEKVISYKIAVLKKVKSLRPNAMVGYYGYPIRYYWNRNDDWRKKNDKLLPLLKESDALFPSVYDFYVDGIDIGENKDMEYVKENVEEALRLAYNLDIPVYPFIWHRYHDSNKKFSRAFINYDEFSNHVSAIAKAEYEDTKAAGLVWWSSEKYFYNIEKRKGDKTILRNEKEDFEDYSTRTTLPFLQAIEKGVKKGQHQHK